MKVEHDDHNHNHGDDHESKPRGHGRSLSLSAIDCTKTESDRSEGAPRLPMDVDVVDMKPMCRVTLTPLSLSKSISLSSSGAANSPNQPNVLTTNTPSLSPPTPTTQVKKRENDGSGSLCSSECDSIPHKHKEDKRTDKPFHYEVSPPCVVGSLFRNIAEFKEKLQEYATKVGFVYVTMRSGSKGQSKGRRVLVLGCKSAGVPRPRPKALPHKQRRRAVESTKIGCESIVKSKVNHDGTVEVVGCKWEHTNGCVPNPSFLVFCRKRSGYYFANLSPEKKSKFKQLMDEGASSQVLMNYMRSVLPPDLRVDSQMLMNWRLKYRPKESENKIEQNETPKHSTDHNSLYYRSRLLLPTQSTAQSSDHSATSVPGLPALSTRQRMTLPAPASRSVTQAPLSNQRTVASSVDPQSKVPCAPQLRSATAAKPMGGAVQLPSIGEVINGSRDDTANTNSTNSGDNRSFKAVLLPPTRTGRLEDIRKRKLPNETTKETADTLPQKKLKLPTVNEKGVTDDSKAWTKQGTAASQQTGVGQRLSFAQSTAKFKTTDLSPATAAALPSLCSLRQKMEQPTTAQSSVQDNSAQTNPALKSFNTKTLPSLPQYTAQFVHNNTADYPPTHAQSTRPQYPMPYLPYLPHPTTTQQRMAQYPPQNAFAQNAGEQMLQPNAQYMPTLVTQYMHNIGMSGYGGQTSSSQNAGQYSTAVDSTKSNIHLPHPTDGTQVTSQYMPIYVTQNNAQQMPMYIPQNAPSHMQQVMQNQSQMRSQAQVQEPQSNFAYPWAENCDNVIWAEKMSQNLLLWGPLADLSNVVTKEQQAMNAAAAATPAPTFASTPASFQRFARPTDAKCGLGSLFATPSFVPRPLTDFAPLDNALSNQLSNSLLDRRWNRPQNSLWKSPREKRRDIGRGQRSNGEDTQMNEK